MLDPKEWISPHLNFAYSLGGSHGMSQKDKPVNVSVLADDFNQPVPCREMHITCTSDLQNNIHNIQTYYCLGQGCKVCPFTDQAVVTQPHCKVTSGDLQLSLVHTNLQQQLLSKTLSLWSSLCKLGCGAPLHKPTFYISKEWHRQEEWATQLEKARRGHEVKATCAGICSVRST